MKIFVSHSRKLDFERDLYKPIRESELNNQHVFFLPHEAGKNINTKSEIESSDLLLAEVSFSRIGGGIEIGWANSAGVPLLCVSQKGTKISDSLKYLTDNFIEYSSPEDLIQKLKEYFKKS